MAATMRRTRNYKEKSTGFTFGHFALPIAAVIALGLLFVGIKLFFLSPPKPVGIPVTPETFASMTHDSPTPLVYEPDFALTEDGAFTGEHLTAGATATDIAIVLAGPLSARDTPASSSGTNTARTNATQATPAASATTAQPAAPPRANAAPANSRWGVQIGAFVNANSATALVSEVQNQGYTASVSRADSSGRTFHRVRISAGNTREDANRLAAELERKGYPVSVVPMQ